MPILVTGATGYVGSRLVKALLVDRHRVVAATRDPQHLKWLGRSADVTPVTGLRDRVPAPPVACPTLGLANLVPGPLAGAVRTGLDMLITRTPKVHPA